MSLTAADERVLARIREHERKLGVAMPREDDGVARRIVPRRPSPGFRVP